MPRHPTTLSSNNSHWMCCPGAFATWRQFYKIGFVGTPQMRSWEIHFLKKLSSMKMENQIKGNLELSRWTRKIAEEDCNLERKWGLAAQFKEERVFSTKCVWLLGGFEIQWSAVRVSPSGNPQDLNFSKTATGITKLFWVTIEGYLSYLLQKSN